METELEALENHDVGEDDEYSPIPDFDGDLPARLISRSSGSKARVEVISERDQALKWSFLYHHLIDLKYEILLGLTLGTWTLLVLVFALLYYLSGEIIHVKNNFHHLGELKWYDWIAFSLQTQETIGYGVLYPEGGVANLILAVHSFVAEIFFAIICGLTFAKISRPSLVKRCFEFSEVACIRRFHRPELEEMSQFQNDDYYDDEEQSDAEGLIETLCLEFRFGTHRPKSQICDSGFTLLLLRWTLHPEDKTKLAYTMHEMDFELNMQRGRSRGMDFSSPLLCLPWTCIHKIDNRSPLFGKSFKYMKEHHFEVIAIVDGIDEATSENFQVKYSYIATELVRGKEFVPMVGWSDKKFIVNMDLISETKDVRPRRFSII